ncbi:hypothetical protein [Haliangium sp.]|uniref:hypothetical protein n=1 Tax=Haliangium sp. TaxID=2663208 RepID=UPI003D0EA0F3
MKRPDPLLCTRFRGVDALRAELRAALATMAFDPERNVVGPEVTSRNPEAALEVRLSVLRRTYRGDYHTDAFDIERLGRQIRSGDEAIWFWGEGAEIDRLRAVLEGGDGSRDLDLGTVTVLSGEGEFGEGHGELCRSGSQSRFSARGAIVYRTLGYVEERERWLRGRYHTLTLVPRNRPSTDEVRGGEAIHRIHSRYVQSRFWGFAPWHVMQGGVLEMLDHRESNRDPSDVVAGLEASAGWHFADADEAAYAEALCQVNFGLAPPVVVAPAPRGTGGLAAKLHLPASAELTRYNHGALTVGADGADGAGDEVGAALERLASTDVCSAVVSLPLDLAAAVPVQRMVAERGFRLTSIRPPKVTWLLRDEQRREVRTGAYGYWCRPRADLEVVQPYYRGCDSDDASERTILQYLRDRLDFPTPEAKHDA